MEHTEKKNNNALSFQVGGDHYKKMKIQPIEFCTKLNLSPCETIVVRYVSRYNNKNGIQDLKKAIHTIQIAKALKHTSITQFANRYIRRVYVQNQIYKYALENGLSSEVFNAINFLVMAEYDKAIKNIEILIENFDITL